MWHVSVPHSMKTTNIRELKHATSTVLGWVADGETVEITRHNKVVALLSPPKRAKRKAVQRPDFAARLKEMWGDRMLPATGTQLMEDDRSER